MLVAELRHPERKRDAGVILLSLSSMQERSARDASIRRRVTPGGSESEGTVMTRSEWLRDLVLPLVLLAVPMLLSLYWVGEVLTLTFPVALAIGAVLRPRRLWPVWIGAILLLWLGALAVEVGLLPEQGESGETVWSFMIESVIFMAALVLLPLWLGRQLMRWWRGDTRGQSGNAPGAGAGSTAA